MCRNNNTFWWLLDCVVIVCESCEPQSWLLPCLGLLTEVSTSAVSMSPEWIIRCFQCHTTLLTFLPSYSALLCSLSVCRGEKTHSRCYEINEMRCVHARASNWWRGYDGRRAEPAALITPFSFLFHPSFPLALHSSHYREERVRSEDCIDLGINYWTLSSFTPAPPPQSLITFT